MLSHWNSPSKSRLITPLFSHVHDRHGQQPEQHCEKSKWEVESPTGARCEFWVPYSPVLSVEVSESMSVVSSVATEDFILRHFTQAHVVSSWPHVQYIHLSWSLKIGLRLRSLTFRQGLRRVSPPPSLLLPNKGKGEPQCRPSPVEY